MPILVCLDASAAVDWLLPDMAGKGDATLDSALRAADEIVAPPLLFAETTSTLSRFVDNGRLAGTDAGFLLSSLFDLAVSLVHEPRIYVRAVELAGKLGHKKAYDTQYIAWAEATGATLLTADNLVHTNAVRLGIEARLLQ